MTLGERMKQERARLGLSQAQLAEAVGVSQQTIQQIEKGTSERTGWIVEIAATLGVTPRWLQDGVGAKAAEGQATVPLVGRVGAGAQVHLVESDVSTHRIDDVEAPPDATQHTVAVIVEGDSMQPVFRDRDLIYYENQPGAPEDLVGRECVVGLADGRVFVKMLMRGSERGLFNLFSYNAPLISDVVVSWAVRVVWVKRHD